VVAVLFIAISVWWFGFREADRALVTERVSGETTVPTLLTPSAIEATGGADAEALLVCDTTIEEWTVFQGGPERTGCISTRPIDTPRILWYTPIGVTGWRNSPVIENGVVYVGSAGVVQFVQDRRDGIYSLDLRTGQQRWLYSTELDVNSVAVQDGVVIAVGDEGRVWALQDEGNQGRLIWLDDLEIGVFGDPLFIGEDVIITDGLGRVWAYNVDSGAHRLLVTLDGAIRGGASFDGEHIFVASENGDVVALNPDYQVSWRIRLEPRVGDTAKVFAVPTVAEDMLLLSIVRPDTFAEPGLFALNKDNGEIIWQAVDRAALKVEWANLRSSPAFAGDYIVFGEGYSDSLVVIDHATGDTLFSIPVGPFCYPHWPSPIINTTADGEAVVYLPRHDGGLYAVELTTREIVWQIYLGDVDGDGRSGAFPPEHNESDFCQWGPENGNSILGSPAIAPDGTIVIGTGEGYMVAVGDPDSDA
jgi:outer membrane protein assembly factor BamB